MECLESFFGAIYLDRGLGPCRSLLAKLVFPLARDLPLRRAWLAAARRPYSPPDTAPRDLEAEDPPLPIPLPIHPTWVRILRHMHTRTHMHTAQVQQPSPEYHEQQQ